MPRPLAAAILAIPCLTWGQDAAPPSWSFGIGLATSAHSQPFGLYLVKEHGPRILATEPITREQFVLQAQGVVRSKANPGSENLFLKYGVRACYHPADSTRPVRDCDVFDELWKLRFWEYPFQLPPGREPKLGWAEKREAPSTRQMLLLSEYGLLTLNGVTRGEYTFRLLRDVSDPEWVDNYRKGY